MDEKMKAQLSKMEGLIQSEVNVKSIEYLYDSEGFIKKKAKPNFKLLGAKLGKNMKAAAVIISALDQHQIASLERTGILEILIDNQPFELTIADVDILAEDVPGWSVASKGNLTVALDITITDTLQEEGNARELVNRIQKIRKDSGFELTDRIAVNILEIPSLKPSIINFYDYICTEILADSIHFADKIPNGIEIEVNDTVLYVLISKI